MMCLGAIGTVHGLYFAMGYADMDEVKLDIDINMIVVVPDEDDIKKTIVKNVETFLKRFHIAFHPIYIELWGRTEFEKYFNIKDGIYNLILKETRPRRGFHFIEGGIHKIAMIYEPGCDKTLRHELTHLIQAETLGFELHEKLANEIYKNKREIDPFELQAYYNEGD
jgi:hypothetical protein